MYKTSRLVRICLLITALNKRVFLFFSGKLFYKSNRKLFPCVCISWYKHSGGWENSRQSCKPATSSRVCITVSNSPNPSHVYIRLCKHGKRFLLLKWYCFGGRIGTYVSAQLLYAPLWGCMGDRVEMFVKVHCETVLGGCDNVTSTYGRSDSVWTLYETSFPLFRNPNYWTLLKANATLCSPHKVSDLP